MGNARKLANIIVGNNVRVSVVDSDLANTVNALKTRLDSDDAKLQSLDTSVNTSINLLKGRMDSDDGRLQSLDTAIQAGIQNLADSDLIINQLQAKINATITNVDSDSGVLQGINTKIAAIKTRLDSDDAKLQSLDTTIQTIKGRLDSDETALQAVATLAGSAISGAGLKDSDLKVVADLRNQLDSEILFVKNIRPSFTDYLFISSQGQTSFSGADSNSNTLYYTVGNIQVFLNGIKLIASDFTATDGSSVTLTQPVDSDAQIVVSCTKLESNIIIPTLNLSALSQLVKIRPTSNNNEHDQFSDVVDLSKDGNYAIVGARGASNGGRFYIFEKSGSSWNQVVDAAFTASGGDTSTGLGGKDVSIDQDGDTAIIGYPNGGPANHNQGRAEIYVRSGSTWSLQAKLEASNKGNNDNFGWTVAISDDGNTAIVGALYEDTGISQAGQVYVYTRSGTTWTQKAQVGASDAATGNGGNLGHTLALSGDGSTFAVGAPAKSYSSYGTNTGRVYVFTYDGNTTVSEQAILEASDVETNMQFGSSMAIDEDGNTVAVGSKGGTSNTHSQQGAVYIFTRSGTSWTQAQKVISPNPAANAYFGTRVGNGDGMVDLTSDGRVLVVGAWGSDGTGGAGYAFSRSGNTFTSKIRLEASDVATNDRNGWSIAVADDGTVLLGSPQDGDGGTNSGSAYVFTI